MAQIEIPRLFSRVATWPSQTLDTALSLVHKIMDILSHFIWPIVPYRPTFEERAILGKIELLKKDSFKPLPPFFKSTQVLAAKRFEKTFPTDSLHQLIDRFLKSELAKAKQTVPEEREKKALATMLPLLNALGAVFAKKQAALLQKVVFTPDSTITPLSPPVKALCEIGKQVLLIGYEEAQKSIQDVKIKELSSLLEPFLGSISEVMLEKLGGVLEKISYSELFDELVKSLSKETKVLMQMHRSVSEEREAVLKVQILQHQQPHDPQIDRYLEKLTRGRELFVRLPKIEQEQLKQTEEKKLTEQRLKIPQTELEAWALTNILIELYLKDFATAKFISNPYCHKNVKEIFQDQSHLTHEEQKLLVTYELENIAEKIIGRFFPVLEQEFHRTILPAVLHMHFSPAEISVVIDSAKEVLPKLWELYLKPTVVTGLTELLQKPASRIFWEEILAQEILPLIQDKLLKQQFKMTIESNLKAFKYLLEAYSFGDNVDPAKICSEVKMKLHGFIKTIPLDEKRIDSVVEELMLSMHQEQFLLRKKLAILADQHRDYLLKNIKKVTSPARSSDLQTLANSKVLLDWEVAVFDHPQNNKSKEFKFCQYAQPLITQLSIELNRKKTGELESEVFTRIINEIPPDANQRWGDIVVDLSEYITTLPKELTPYKKPISELFAYAVEPYRNSCLYTVDQLVTYSLSKFGKEEEVAVDPKKLTQAFKELSLPLPNLQKELSEQIALTAEMAHRLFVNHVAYTVIPYYVPFKNKVMQFKLVGHDSTLIRQLTENLIQGLFGNPYANLNRLHEVVEKILPALDKAIESKKA